MQTAVLTNKGFVLRDVKRPECGPGEVLVRATALGVCTGDVERYRWTLGEKPAELMLGHEGSGCVAAVGRGVKRFREGDAVTALGGPYAEYFVTRPEVLVRLPEGIDPVWALGEPLACVMHAGARCGIELGDRVALLGCGFMGLLCLQAARLRGAAQVVAMDPVPWRLKVATKFGADTVYQLPTDSTEGVAKELGEFDVALEVAGVQGAVTLAGELVREHGRLLLIGYHLSEGGMRRINMERWNYKALDVINGHVRRDDEKVRAMQAGVNLLAAGRIKTEALVTQYALSDINQAFRDLVDRKRGLFKAVLVPEG